VPEGGVQATVTLPWPFRISANVYETATPAPVGAEAVTGAGQMTSGGAATGGAGGVGALGELLHPAPHVSASTVRKIFTVPNRIHSYRSS